METDQITGKIIGCAFKVHTALGPGLLESAYHRCLVHDLQKAGLGVESELALPIAYNGLKIDAAYRVDVGLLLNFNVAHMLDGIKRFIR